MAFSEKRLGLVAIATDTSTLTDTSTQTIVAAGNIIKLDSIDLTVLASNILDEVLVTVTDANSANTVADSRVVTLAVSGNPLDLGGVSPRMDGLRIVIDPNPSVTRWSSAIKYRYVG